MSDVTGVLVALYLFGFLFSAVLLKASYDDAGWRQSRRRLARLGFLTPVWPVLVLFVICSVLKGIWDAAEWGRK